jgi:hypothetical protein
MMLKPPARAVYGCTHGNRPRSVFRSTLAKASFVERDSRYVTISRTRVKDIVTINVTNFPVIAGLVPAISMNRAPLCHWNRDGRDEPGHDGDRA